jgi:hypothetical protein
VFPLLTRSSLHRCLQRHGISRLPKADREKPKKFKDYEIGYFHIDIVELRYEGGKGFLLVAVDCTSKLAFDRAFREAGKGLENMMLRGRAAVENRPCMMALAGAAASPVQSCGAIWRLLLIDRLQLLARERPSERVHCGASGNKKPVRCLDLTGFSMVGVGRIELPTPAMSTQGIKPKRADLRHFWFSGLAF